MKSTPEQKAVLITIMCLANHKENEWEWKGEKFKVKPGQFVTSLESIRKKTGLGISIQNVRSSLNRFKKLQFLTYKSTRSGRMITICNWEQYQPIEKPDQQRPQQRGNKGATTNKNDKNDKNIKTLYEKYKKDISPLKKSATRAKENIGYYLKKYPFENLESAIDNYATTLNGCDPKYRKDPANFFGKVDRYFVDFLPENFEPIITDDFPDQPPLEDVVS